MIESLQKLIPWLVGLPVFPKVLFSLCLVLLTAFVLVIVWTSPPATMINDSSKLWPQEKTVHALQRLIERTSVTNRRVLSLILAAGRDGIYANDLAKQMAITRDEVIYRAKELTSLDLIETIEMTDKNYRLSESVKQLLGPGNKKVLEALLESEEKPREIHSPSTSLSQPLFAEIVGPSTIVVGKRAIYRAEFDGDLEFEWHYTQPVKLTDRNVFVELGYAGQTETLTLRVKSPDGRTYTTSRMITAVAPP